MEPSLADFNPSVIYLAIIPTAHSHHVAGLKEELRENHRKSFTCLYAQITD